MKVRESRKGAERKDSERKDRKRYRYEGETHSRKHRMRHSHSRGAVRGGSVPGPGNEPRQLQSSRGMRSHWEQ